MSNFNFNKPAGAIAKAVSFCAIFLILLIGFSLFKLPMPKQFERFVYGVLGTLAALLATYIFLKIDRKTFASIGLKFERRTIARFAFGVLVGLAITALMFSILLWFTALKLERNPSINVTDFLWLILALVPLAFMEEVAFRAYPLLILNRRIGLWPSLLVMALLFSLYHIANGWDVAISFLGPGVWALVFGVAAIYSKGIAMPTGIHFAANLTQAAIGMKKEVNPIWNMVLSDGIVAGHDEAMVGYAVQFGLMLFAIILIEWYRRKNYAVRIRVQL